MSFNDTQNHLPKLIWSINLILIVECWCFLHYKNMIVGAKLDQWAANCLARHEEWLWYYRNGFACFIRPEVQVRSVELQSIVTVIEVKAS